MRIRCMVRDERPESFTKKNGQQVNQRALHMVDSTVEGVRMGEELILPMTADEAARFSGKLRDRFIIVDIGGLQEFAKAFKIRDGGIVSVEGNPPLK